MSYFLKVYLGDEPLECCRRCRKYFCLSTLRKHVQTCKKKSEDEQISKEVEM